jgi:hypothetical protein
VHRPLQTSELLVDQRSNHSQGMQLWTSLAGSSAGRVGRKAGDRSRMRVLVGFTSHSSIADALERESFAVRHG